MNYYKRHLGDYARDTAHLSMAEDGAYNRLLDFYYAAERPLPLERAEIYRRVRARGKQDQAAVDAVLADFFNLKDDGWHHKRCDEEIAAMMEKAQTNRENGKGGGRPKKKPNNNPEKTQSVSGGNDGGLRLETLATNPLATNKSKEGADAPSGVWSVGIKILTEGGMKQTTARSYIAKLLKSWDDDAVTDALEESRGTAEPESYVMKLLQAKPKKRVKSDPWEGAH